MPTQSLRIEATSEKAKIMHAMLVPVPCRRW